MMTHFFCSLLITTCFGHGELLVALHWPPVSSWAEQTEPFGNPLRRYQKQEWESQLQTLRKLYGTNKEIPKEYELAALLALSHYPQLRHTRVKFIVDDVRIPIASRPAIGTMFRAKKNWVYHVVISNSKSWGSSPALLQNMTFNAQIGALGHELGHTVYYQKRSLWQMIGAGVCFISKPFRIKFERETDLRAIDYGLGWQLYDWSLELRSGRKKDNPNSWLDAFYLSPELIEAEMTAKPLYGSNLPAK